MSILQCSKKPWRANSRLKFQDIWNLIHKVTLKGFNLPSQVFCKHFSLCLLDCLAFFPPATKLYQCSFRLSLHEPFLWVKAHVIWARLYYIKPTGCCARLCNSKTSIWDVSLFTMLITESNIRLGLNTHLFDLGPNQHHSRWKRYQMYYIFYILLLYDMDPNYLVWTQFSRG